ncbi:Pancreatic secretory granule membrane major glycoprotein GP2 [Merluccius polli]|uniref:Pancreatic secretory granule membrane major glycoprotein GP2 n=1 Tax=Merluccius polli TaxID=89951 RepID=A0AA47M6Z8_MERPO|nr:Pancreatic secretory granule membrane major glycoprotein GP2 [Merluccius polli]
MSLVKVNASLVLGVAMALYSDASYASSYHNPVELDPEDFLFFHVELQSNDSFAPDVLLQLASCWASETSDPQDPVQALLLQDGCAVDPTLQWGGANGRGSSTRFSLQMFHMPTLLPLFFHCLTHVCGPDQDCTPALSRRAGLSGEAEAVVSSGPLLVRGGTAPHSPPALCEFGIIFKWAEGRVLLWLLGGFIGCLALALLAISAASRLRC